MKQKNKVTAVATISSALECYDFVVYATLIPYLNHNFFPETDSIIQSFYTLMVFAIGYISRPIGGILFGVLGDKYGRKKTFVYSITLMALSTVLISFLPTYFQAGAISTFLLILCRFIQGVSQGGEVPGAITFVAEHVKDKSVNKSCALIFLGLGFGALLSSMVCFILTNTLSNEAMISWGWRIPFLFGGVLAIVSFFIRKKTAETPQFLNLKPQNKASKPPLYLFINHYKDLIGGFSMVFLAASLVAITLTYPAYMSRFTTLNSSTVYWIMSLGMLSMALLAPVFGSISDRIGSEKVFIGSASSCLILSPVIFNCISNDNLIGNILFVILIQSIIAAFLGSFPSILVKSFPTKVRFTGIAISYNAAFAISAFVPALSHFIAAKYQSHIFVGFIYSFLGLITLILWNLRRKVSFFSMVKTNNPGIKKLVHSLIFLSLIPNMNGCFANPNIKLNQRLNNPLLRAMKTLNHLPEKYPEAISLAPGKPADEFCTPDISTISVETFKSYAQKKYNVPLGRLLGQYGPIQGIINDIIAQHLKIDEGIDLQAKDIIVTVGFQEASLLCAATIFQENDVLLVPDPGYIGMTGIASIFSIPTFPIECKGSLNLKTVENSIKQVISQGKKPKALYISTSYSNPQGTTLSLSERHALLNLAEKYDFFIIEDATYSLFGYEGVKLPSLRALDTNDRVIYIGSFAKTIYPALRIGYIALGGMGGSERGKSASLIEPMLRIKSFTTINTPALDQAVVGGVLLNNKYTLKKFLRKKKLFFKKNRDVMLKTLGDSLSKVEGVSWSKPKGGFFISVTLPFNFTIEMVEVCARENKVIVLPMSLLSLNQKPSNQVRLSFTTVTAEKVREAVKNFAEFIKKQRRSI